MESVSQVTREVVPRNMISVPTAVIENEFGAVSIDDDLVCLDIVYSGLP